MIIFLLCVGQVPTNLKVAVYNEEVYDPLDHAKYVKSMPKLKHCYNLSIKYLDKIDEKYIDLV